MKNCDMDLCGSYNEFHPNNCEKYKGGGLSECAHYRDKFLKKKPRETSLDIQIGGNHYKEMPIQPIEYTHKNGLNFCQGNIIKYVTRYKSKNGIEDLKKAKHYIDLLIDLEYGEQDEQR